MGGLARDRVCGPARRVPRRAARPPLPPRLLPRRLLPPRLPPLRRLARLGPRGFCCNHELMIVVALFGILAALWLPLYARGMRELRGMGVSFGLETQWLMLFVTLLLTVTLVGTVGALCVLCGALLSFLRKRTSRAVTTLVRALGTAVCTVGGAVSLRTSYAWLVAATGHGPRHDPLLSLGHLLVGVLCLGAALWFLPADTDPD